MEKIALEAARLLFSHDGAGWIVAVLLGLDWRIRRRETAAWPVLAEPFTALLTLAVAQGTLGYAQYLNEVPVVLVAFHVAGAVAVWWAAVRLALATRAVAPAAVPSRRHEVTVP